MTFYRWLEGKSACSGGLRFATKQGRLDPKEVSLRELLHRTWKPDHILWLLTKLQETPAVRGDAAMQRTLAAMAGFLDGYRTALYTHYRRYPLIPPSAIAQMRRRFRQQYLDRLDTIVTAVLVDPPH